MGGTFMRRQRGISASLKLEGKRERPETFHPWCSLSLYPENLPTQDEYSSEGKAASFALKKIIRRTPRPEVVRNPDLNIRQGKNYKMVTPS